MRYGVAFIAVMGMLALSSCASTETPAAVQSTNGPHVVVRLKGGTTVPGVIVWSSQTDLVVAGDDGIERQIPLGQIRSVEYSEARSAAPAPAPTPAPTTRTYVLPAGSEVSVRTNEAIDSGSAAEGQTFDAQITRDAEDSNGDVVIPRGSRARIVIQSASKGSRFRGASDLFLDVQSVNINGKRHIIDTGEIAQKGEQGVGANQRTAGDKGGGAALGAIIGAIAGGGKGAGFGGGRFTQVIAKGGAIKAPAESVLTFSLDKPLRVVAAE